MKLYLTIFFSLIPFNKVKIFLLNCIGHRISYRAKIGLSIIMVDNLILEEKSEIKHFNFIKIVRLHLRSKSSINNLNYIKGYFNVELSENSGISNQNKIRRSYPPVVNGISNLYLGQNSFIVSNHFLDLTCSVSIGDNSILAGIGSQIWTHGYYHADHGPERIRIDGEVNIGKNVYVGSSCLFNPGVKVSDSIHLGGGGTVSKDLIVPGMYVGQPLRHINNDINKIKIKLKESEPPNVTENVYKK